MHYYYIYFFYLHYVMIVCVYHFFPSNNTFLARVFLFSIEYVAVKICVLKCCKKRHFLLVYFTAFRVCGCGTFLYSMSVVRSKLLDLQLTVENHQKKK